MVKQKVFDLRGCLAFKIREWALRGEILWWGFLKRNGDVNAKAEAAITATKSGIKIKFLKMGLELRVEEGWYHPGSST